MCEIGDINMSLKWPHLKFQESVSSKDIFELSNVFWALNNSTIQYFAFQYSKCLNKKFGSFTFQRITEVNDLGERTFVLEFIFSLTMARKYKCLGLGKHWVQAAQVYFTIEVIFYMKFYPGIRIIIIHD